MQHANCNGSFGGIIIIIIIFADFEVFTSKKTII